MIKKNPRDMLIPILFKNIKSTLDWTTILIITNFSRNGAI